MYKSYNLSWIHLIFFSKGFGYKIDSNYFLCYTYINCYSIWLENSSKSNIIALFLEVV